MAEWIKKMFKIYILIFFIYIYNVIKVGNPVICGNMDEPGEQYPKWNKRDTEGQILHGISYMRNLKELNS